MAREMTGCIAVRKKEPEPAWRGWGLSVLLALMPLCFTADFRAKALPAVLLFVAGIVILIRTPERRRNYVAAWPIVAVALLGVAQAVLGMLLHGLGWRVLGLPGHVVGYLLIAAVFTRPLKLRLIWSGFSLTAIFLGLVCLQQHYLRGEPRAHGLNGGSWTAIEFAMVLLALVLFALQQLLVGDIDRIERCVHGGAVVFGLWGALLTQSRGPLLAFVPVFLLLLALWTWRTRNWWSALGVFVLVGVVAFAVSLGMRGEIAQRIASVGAEVETYDARHNADGAVRERLEMWRTALRAVGEHPLAGVGSDRFGEYVRAEVAAGRSNPSIAKYQHAHSEYLEAAATGGMPGLLGLLLLFVVPGVWFARRAWARDDDGVAPAAGLAVVCLYALCAFTDNVFYRPMPHSLFYFTVLGLALLVGRRQVRQAG